MNVLVLGAGAVGLSVAAKLSQVCSVHAVCRARHAAAVAADGLRMTGIWGEHVYRFSCDPALPAGTRWDYVLVTAKSLDTRSLCEQFAPALAAAEVVSLQNGIGNEEIIAEYADRVIGGTIITGFEWRGDARVHVSVQAGPVRLGRFPQGMDAAVERLVGAFCEAGIACEASAEIRSHLWAKTLYNCALNPLGAIMGVAYGELAHAAAWGIIEQVTSEAYAVCAAEGVVLPWPTAGDYLGYLREVQLPATAGHHSSMLQDLGRGHRTEIDFLNGAVWAKARTHGIATPVNATMTRLIHFKEALTGAGAPAAGVGGDAR
jgi:2-dehydropantoate 2-reductase